MTTKLDLAQICPTMATIDQAFEAFDRDQIGITREEWRAIARDFLAQQAKIEALREENEAILVYLYRNGAATQVAGLCDKKLDQSGALLGRIRSKAEKAARQGGGGE